MQIELVVKGTRLGNYARERVEHKLAKSVERHHREIPVRVAVEERKGLYAARVTSAVNGKELLGHSESRSVLEALDEAVLKFERQLMKVNKRNSRGHQRHRGSHRHVHALSRSIVEDAEDQQTARVQTGLVATTVY